MCESCACGVSGWDELATALAADFQNTVSCSCNICNSNRAFHSYFMISWTAGHLFLVSPWFAVSKSKWQRRRLGRDQPSQGRKNFNRWVLDHWFPIMGSTSEIICNTLLNVMDVAMLLKRLWHLWDQFGLSRCEEIVSTRTSERSSAAGWPTWFKCGAWKCWHSNRFGEANRTDTTFIDDSWTRNIRSVASRQDTTAAAISWILCSLMFHYCKAHLVESALWVKNGIIWYNKWNGLHQSQETRKVSSSCRVHSWNRMSFEIQLKFHVLGRELSQILIQLAWSDRLRAQTAYKLYDESPCSCWQNVSRYAPSANKHVAVDPDGLAGLKVKPTWLAMQWL